MPDIALFVSKSIPSRAVIAQDAAFTQTITLKNAGDAPWTGWKLVRLDTYGASGKTCDRLGVRVKEVAVPATQPGAEAVVVIPKMRGTKSDAKSGAAQSAPWELRKADGTKVPVMIDPATQAKGGCVWTVVTLNPPQAPSIPNLNHAAYTDKTQNTYVSIGYGGQCTAFVYGRIKEKLNIDLTKVPGASFGCNAAGQKWIDQLTGPGKPYTLSPEPKANSIAVWSFNADPNVGHVAFIESVDAAGATLNEANASSMNSFAASNGPESDFWGGGYDGIPKKKTLEQLKNHLGSKYTLRGFIAVS
jgi:surface antigen